MVEAIRKKGSINLGR
jgi:hypothetical protein